MHTHREKQQKGWCVGEITGKLCATKHINGGVDGSYGDIFGISKCLEIMNKYRPDTVKNKV